MVEPINPIVPEGTPLPPAPAGVPPYPITPFAVWTWSTPVIPQFYWNIYSSEQRIKSICKEIGRIEAYLNYLTNKVNENLIEIHRLITELTERVAALEKKLEEEVARLDALIAKLREDLTQEIHDREEADKALGERIDQEIVDRTHGDDQLHGEISQETQDRIHADDQLHTEISQETQAREDADTALETRLTAAIAQRLLPTDVTAGEEISITRPDPSSNRIVIASTVAHSISELETEISGLQAALEAEVSERRADDTKLWAAVNQRIERGKILAGTGISVVNDPDASTVTISATGGGTGGINKIEGTAPITVEGTSSSLPGGEVSTGTSYTIGVSAATEENPGVITEARVKELAGSGSTTITAIEPLTAKGTPEEGYTLQMDYDPAVFETKIDEGDRRLYLKADPDGGIVLPREDSDPGISVRTSTESQAGIITEARVKALASTVAPSLSAEAPLKLEDGRISLTKDPAGPVTSSSAGLSVREITPETSSETETGVVSKATIKSLVKPFDGGVDPSGGLETTIDGLLAVKFGSNTDYNNLGVGSDGELTLVGRGTTLGASTKTLAEPMGGLTDWGTGFWAGRPQFLQDTNSPNNPSKAEFVLSSGVFEVQEAGSTAWTTAELGTFELVSYPDRLREGGAAAGYPQYYALYARITPYGQSYYTSTTEVEGRVKIQGLRVHYAYYDVYALPVTA